MQPRLMCWAGTVESCREECEDQQTPQAHLQMGQTARRWLSHWSMHSMWYLCRQPVFDTAVLHAITHSEHATRLSVRCWHSRTPAHLCLHGSTRSFSPSLQSASWLFRDWL